MRICKYLLLALLLSLWAGQGYALSPQQRVVLFGHPFVGVIDQLGVTPAADYSSRCLTRKWLGKHVFNIRRTSDNATTDLNCLAPAGNLDTATFNSFCAATTCFVAKAYDQSGNGNDAVQATAANQPQLVLNSQNGHPALIGGSGIYLASTTGGATGNPAHTIIAAGAYSSSVAIQPLASLSFSSVGSSVVGTISGNYWYGGAGHITPAGGAASVGAHILSKTADGTTVNGWVDGGSNVSLAQTYSLIDSQIVVFSYNGNYWLGEGFEQLVFLSVLTTAQRQLVERSMKAFWGTP